MKQLSDVKKEIKSIEGLSYDETKDMLPKDYKKLMKKLELLRVMEKYLETSPSNEFVESELNRLEAVVTAKMLEFQKVSDERKYGELPRKEVTKLKNKHESMYDIPHIRTQVRALRFLAQ